MSEAVLKCEARALRSALAMLRAVVATRTTIPILQCVRIRRARHGATVTATDLDIEVTVPFAADLPTGFDVAVDFARLYRLLSLMPGETPVWLCEEVAGEFTGRAFLRFRGAQYGIPAASPADFPQPIGAGLGRRCNSVKLALPADFAATLATVSRFISTEETRYYLNGVSFFRIDAALCLVATDGHRLCYAPLAGLKDPILDKGGVEVHPIVPREAVRVLLSSKSFIPEAVTIYEDSPVAAFDCAGGVRVALKLIDGSFPDVNRVIPDPKPLKLKPVLPVAAFKAALLRACAVAGGRSKAISLSFESKCVWISTAEREHGVNAELIDIEKGAPSRFSIGFNARYLLDVIDCNRGQESLQIQMCDPEKPCLVVGEKASFVLMPLRDFDSEVRIEEAARNILSAREEVPA